MPRDAIPHGGRGRKTVALIVALVALALVIWAVVSGFRGREIKRNAEALTEPVLDPAQPDSSRPSDDAARQPVRSDADGK